VLVQPKFAIRTVVSYESHVSHREIFFSVREVSSPACSCKQQQDLSNSKLKMY
jgi:hypothetical protein